MVNGRQVRGTSLRQRVGINKPFSKYGLKHIHFFSLKIIKFETAKSAQHIYQAVPGEL